MTPDDQKKADSILMNWSRYVSDHDWLDQHLLIDPPPTSKGYLAPAIGCDEVEPVRMPVDEQDGAISEHVIVAMGYEDGGGLVFKECLRYWYLRLRYHECTTEERYMRLSKGLHCSARIAPDMLRMAQAMFLDRKLTMDALARLIACKTRKNG